MHCTLVLCCNVLSISTVLQYIVPKYCAVKFYTLVLCCNEQHISTVLAVWFSIVLSCTTHYCNMQCTTPYNPMLQWVLYCSAPHIISADPVPSSICAPLYIALSLWPEHGSVGCSMYKYHRSMHSSSLHTHSEPSPTPPHTSRDSRPSTECLPDTRWGEFLYNAWCTLDKVCEFS